MRFAVIPSNNRPCLRDCIAAITPQVDHVIVVWNGPAAGSDGFSVGHLPDYTALNDGGDVSISRWWNMGLTHARMVVGSSGWGAGRSNEPRPKWDVAILNDDAIVPPGWFDAVSQTMRDLKAAAGCSGGHDPMPVLHTQPGPVGLETRMQGFAFMVRGEAGLRANEDLKWYFTDDYIDWESRKLGGMVMVPGFHVQHLHPNGQVTPEIQAQTAADAQTFVDIYGMRPW